MGVAVGVKPEHDGDYSFGPHAIARPSRALVLDPWPLRVRFRSRDEDWGHTCEQPHVVRISGRFRSHNRGCFGLCGLAGERPATRLRPQQVLGSGRGLSVAHVVPRGPRYAHKV